MSQDGITHGEDGIARCAWAGTSPDYQAYHDTEWGFPVTDDVRLFEKLSLEGFQSGLSWLTILRKREAFRTLSPALTSPAWRRFDGPRCRRGCWPTPAIVRHRGQDRGRDQQRRVCDRSSSTKQARSPRTSGRFAAAAAGAAHRSRAPAREPTTPESTRRSRVTSNGADGRFVGPTTVYAFMQAMGLVNDHLLGCEIRTDVDRARARFARP